MMFKTYILILIGILTILSNQKSIQEIFLPILPAGKYALTFEKMFPCGSHENHKIALNLYFSRKSINTTEIVGNITIKIPFDNSVSIDVNFAVMSSMGGWQENAHVVKSDGCGCNFMKSLLGNFWDSLMKSANMTNKCPIPPGIYVTSGVDRKYLNDNNFPKEFFYGKYKSVIKFLNKNKVVLGCLEVIVNVVRPWEA